MRPNRDAKKKKKPQGLWVKCWCALFGSHFTFGSPFEKMNSFVSLKHHKTKGCEGEEGWVPRHILEVRTNTRCITHCTKCIIYSTECTLWKSHIMHNSQHQCFLTVTISSPACLWLFQICNLKIICARLTNMWHLVSIYPFFCLSISWLPHFSMTTYPGRDLKHVTKIQSLY